jgi:uncharacterized protein
MNGDKRMKILFSGGSSEVGASCVFIKIDGKNLVIDCGIRMTTSDQLPDLQLIKDEGRVDAIFLSHAHMDHSGSLPILSREYPDASIYMTHATKDLVRVLLYDSLKIMDSRESEIPVFAEVHVKNMLNRILCFTPSYTVKPFADKNITVTFYNAGHILGASSIYITGDEGAVFYSGDFSKIRQRTVEGAFIPKLRPDVAIFESTYGDRLHSNRDNEEQRLIDKVREIIESGKKILIPAFALGRAQEIILILKNAINRGSIKPFKIYVDGMVNDICRIYNQNPNYLRSQLQKKIFKGNEIFYDDNIIRVPKNNVERENIIKSNDPCCIISSSGMLTGGPSQYYAERLVLDEGNFIAITGYQDEESPGRALLDLVDSDGKDDRFLKLGATTVKVRCGFGKYGLSAHADKTEIISAIHLMNAKNVFLVHGNKEVSQSLALELQKEYRTGFINVPINGETFDVLIKKPRKQFLKRELQTLLKKESLLDNENIKELWKFVKNSYSATTGFTMEELIYMWYGKVDLDSKELIETHAEVINSSIYFVHDIRRPFILYVTSEDELNKDDGVMEVNKMLATVSEFFTTESGLYKKGANFNEKIALLYFDFPKNIKTQFSDEILRFEEVTGWKIEINKECRISAAEALIESFLSGISEIEGKISFHRENDLFKVKLLKDLEYEVEKNICDLFNKKTGLYLELVSNEIKQNVIFTRNVTNAIEQNKALTIIGLKFEKTEDKLYKKSIKVVNGAKVIELSFISPRIGEKYLELIGQIEKETCWTILINQTPNQNEILNIGIKLFSEFHLPLKRNLSYHSKEKTVRAVIEELKIEDISKLDILKEVFLKRTGLELEIVKK